MPKRCFEILCDGSPQLSEGHSSTYQAAQKRRPFLPPQLKQLTVTGIPPSSEFSSPTLSLSRTQDEVAGLRELLNVLIDSFVGSNGLTVGPQSVREALERHNMAAPVTPYLAARSSCPPGREPAGIPQGGNQAPSVCMPLGSACPQAQHHGTVHRRNTLWSRPGVPEKYTARESGSCGSCCSYTECTGQHPGAVTPPCSPGAQSRCAASANQDLKATTKSWEAAVALALCAQPPTADGPRAESLYSQSIEAMATAALQVLSLLFATVEAVE